MKLAILHNVPTEKKNTIESAPDEDVLDTAKDIMKALSQDIDVLKFDKSIIPILKKYDVIINFAEKCEGSEYPEDEIAKHLEENDIKFTGAGSRLLTLTMDKKLIKECLIQNNIRTPRYIITDKPIDVNLNFPLIVKPSKEHASIGISKDSVVYDEESLKNKILEIKEKFSQSSLVEEFIDGIEINAALLGSDVLPFYEVTFNSSKSEPKLVTYDAKWDKNSEDYANMVIKCPAEIDHGLKNTLKELSLNVTKAFKSHQYTRIEFKIKDNIPYVIDVNPNPCISTDSEFVRSAKEASYDFKAVIEKIISIAKNS